MVIPGPSGSGELTSPGLMKSAAARKARQKAADAAGRTLAGRGGMARLL